MTEAVQRTYGDVGSYGRRPVSHPIGGSPINLLNMPKGCAFCPRCENAMKICLREKPEEIRISDTHLASCFMNIREYVDNVNK